jgi:hypothetical protein
MSFGIRSRLSLVARNPKRVSTPFDPEYGEDSLHFSYNYPELLKLLN